MKWHDVPREMRVCYGRTGRDYTEEHPPGAISRSNVNIERQWIDAAIFKNTFSAFKDKLVNYKGTRSRLWRLWCLFAVYNCVPTLTSTPKYTLVDCPKLKTSLSSPTIDQRSVSLSSCEDRRWWRNGLFEQMSVKPSLALWHLSIVSRISHCEFYLYLLTLSRKV